MFFFKWTSYLKIKEKYQNVETRFLFQKNIQTSLSERNICVNIGVDLKSDQVEDEEDAEDNPKELLDLGDRHERRSYQILSHLKNWISRQTLSPKL